MTTKRRLTLLPAAGTLLVATAALIGAGTVAESTSLPVLSYDMTVIADAAAPIVDQQPEALAVTDQPVVEAVAQIDSAALDCMAKVIHHEARNQPRTGQIAVAQTLLNRVKAGGRFGDTICAVANQPGQFFDTASYRPSRDTDTWANAVDVSRAVLRGEEDVEGRVREAMYFRAAASPANSFFRTRQRVGAIGDHIFYR